MYHARILTFGLLYACRPPAAFVLDEPADTDLKGLGDTDDTPACEGSLTLSFADTPTGLIAQGSSWMSTGTAWSTSAYLSADYQVQKDDQGCVVLSAGTLSIDLLGTGCAGSAARVTLTDRCGPSCTVVRVLAAEESLAETRNDTSDVERTLSLAPAKAFGTVEVGSLHASVCAVDFDLTPIPTTLQPKDTGSPF